MTERGQARVPEEHVRQRQVTQTTIKVPTEVRDRVQHHARRAHISQAAVLERALDLLDREAFFDQLRSDIAECPETPEDRAERDAWLAEPPTAAE